MNKLLVSVMLLGVFSILTFAAIAGQCFELESRSACTDGGISESWCLGESNDDCIGFREIPDATLHCISGRDNGWTTCQDGADTTTCLRQFNCEWDSFIGACNIQFGSDVFVEGATASYGGICEELPPCN